MVPCQQGTPSCPAKAPFQFGFLTGTGYDRATGLGSVDAYNFVTGWGSSVVPTTTTLAISPPSPVLLGTSVTFTATVSPAPTVTNPPQVVVFSDRQFHVYTPLGTGPLSAAGVATLTTRSLPFGSSFVTAAFGGDSAFGGSTTTSPISVQSFTIAANPTTVTVGAPGQSGTTTLTITPMNGFSQAISYSCSGLPAEASCTFAAASASTETLTIQTTAPSARLDKGLMGQGNQFFYALLLPGFLGLVSAGNRKRTLRGARLLGLIAVLALSTLWMPACGGGSSTPSNPGTPTGSSPVTVTATAGIIRTVQITVTVQ